MKKSILVCFLALFAAGLDLAAQAAGKIVSLQGRAEIRKVGAAPWLPAANLQVLANGDTIRTLAQSRAVLLLADESQVKLNSNTTLELRNIRQTSNLLQRIVQTSAAQGGQSLLGLSSGQAWLKSKLRPANVTVATPAVTAAIRGTEFDLLVAADGESTLSVLEGLVDFRNDLGAVLVASGEQGRARIGQAPTKSVLLRPRDAVQWTLFYSGAISSADYPLLNETPARLRTIADAARTRSATNPGDVSNLLLLARAEHDLGDKKKAEEALVAALAAEPANAEVQADLAWIYLETNRTAQAIELLERIPSPGDRATVTLAMAYYRRGEAERFFDTIRKVDPARSSLAATQRAFSELLYGNVPEARRLLETVAASDPNYAVAQGLLSNVQLAQNEKDQALASAERAVASAPSAPSAHLNLSLARQSFFQIDEALASARRALELDPDFVQAQAQVARLLFATGNSGEAERIARQGLVSNPQEAALTSLLGFILLGQAKTDEAITHFTRSLTQDGTRGEPHLGIGIALMRRGESEEAAQSILIASTLEPQISLYQSYLGKAFYEQRRFEMAFDALSDAVTLDVRDPTPHLYSGIFHADLSQPGAAVRALTRSIRLNDNRAVYRSRFLLDEDRATRNVSLANSFNDLGLSEWANYEALKSQLADATNSSTHIFLAQTFLNLPGRLQAAGSEQLLARLLLPVNANSFNSFNDYTTLFEEPEANWTVEGQAGSFRRRAQTVLGSGGTSRFAYGVIGTSSRSNGFRPVNDDRESYDAVGQFKFALTPHSDMLVLASHGQQNAGNIARGIIDLNNDPNIQVFDRRNRVELGYHSQLRPGSDAVVYLSAETSEVILNDDDVLHFGFLKGGRRTSTRKPNVNLQASHLHKAGPVQLRYGLDVFEGRSRRRVSITFPPVGTLPADEQIDDPELQKVRYKNAFVHGDLTVHPRLVVTGGLHYDWASDDNFNDLDVRRPVSKWNPQGGVFFTPRDSTTFRFAAFRHFQTHFRERLAPTNLHGFVLSQNDLELSQNTSFNFGWDQRFTSSSFFRATAFWRDRRTPFLEIGNIALSATNHFHGGRLVWNQLLGERWGLVPEYSVVRNEEFGGAIRHEHDARIALAFIDASRWSARLIEHFIHQGANTGSSRIEARFFTTDAAVGYELPRKLGFFSVGVINLFDREFALVVDPLALDARVPRRQVVASLKFNF
ncbi:MAG: tetratricopeptide repeat protein [Acidobacteriota bacterium]